MKLSQGQVIRCSNGHNSIIGRICLASENGASIAVALDEDDVCIRMANGSQVIAPMLALSIDYESETVTDLFGNDWYVEVADEPIVDAHQRKINE